VPDPSLPRPVAADTVTVAWDASAYRALARTADGDVEAVRTAARDAADAERAAGRTPVASPYALWPLLAEALEPEPDEDAPKSVRKRAAMSPEAASAPARRAALARMALVACVTHCTPSALPGAVAAVIDWDDEVAANAKAIVPQPLMLEDPESALVVVAGGKIPKDHATFNLYLASTAADLAADPTAARAKRLAGPLDHIRERATLIEGDFADEMQDAIVAAYEAAGRRLGRLDQRGRAAAAGGEGHGPARARRAGRAGRPGRVARRRQSERIGASHPGALRRWTGALARGRRRGGAQRDRAGGLCLAAFALGAAAGLHDRRVAADGRLRRSRPARRGPARQAGRPHPGRRRGLSGQG
jgi:hypothetical protein